MVSDLFFFERFCSSNLQDPGMDNLETQPMARYWRFVSYCCQVAPCCAAKVWPEPAVPSLDLEKIALHCRNMFLIEMLRWKMKPHAMTRTVSNKFQVFALSEGCRTRTWKGANKYETCNKCMLCCMFTGVLWCWSLRWSCWGLSCLELLVNTFCKSYYNFCNLWSPNLSSVSLLYFSTGVYVSLLFRLKPMEMLATPGRPELLKQLVISEHGHEQPDRTQWSMMRATMNLLQENRTEFLK